MRKLLAATAAFFVGALPMGAQQKAPSRPPITGIARVSVYTSHRVQSRHFYGTFLGFPERGTAHRRYRVNADQWIQVDPLPPGVSDFLESVAFATPDVEAMRSYLIGRGIAIPDKVQRGPDGTRLFWVKDPEGHRIGFIQRGSANDRTAPVVATRQEQPISHHILHAGFIVRDRAQEDRFFHDVLGFHQAWEGGRNDKEIDWVDMQVPDGTDWLEYMLHGSAPVSAAQRGVSNHFSLGVPNMHEAMELLEQRGWQSASDGGPHIGRDGKWQLNLYDPNGTRVELMEFRTVQIPCCSPYTLPIPR